MFIPRRRGISSSQFNRPILDDDDDDDDYGDDNDVDGLRDDKFLLSKQIQV